jgi:hypothetical protein
MKGFAIKTLCTWFEAITTKHFYTSGRKTQNHWTESVEDFDPCHFVSDRVICLDYVDIILFFSPLRDGRINKAWI